MTELVEYPGQIAYTQPDPTGGRLVAWADGLEAAHRIGSALCRTAFVPKHFAGKPDEAAAAILFGDEIGFTPTQALRSVFVISGTPGLYARAMVALVLNRGHDVWTDKESDESVTVCGRRQGSEHVEKVTWTTARARQAGYTSNAKYETDPRAMLYARAASDVCRRIAPDALAGLAHSVEELELDQAPPVTRTVRRAKAEQVPMPEPPLIEAATKTGGESGQEETPGVGVADGSNPSDTPDSSPDTPDAVTPAQLTKIGAAMGDLKLKAKADALEYVNNTLGLTGHDDAITSRSDLTKAQAHKVIDALERDINGAPTEPPLDDWPGAAG